MKRFGLDVRSSLIGGLMLALAACGGNDDTQDIPPPPAETGVGEVVERSRSDQVAADQRERERQRLAARSGESAFEYVRYAPDTSGDLPKACLVFSAPLDPDADYSVFVELSGEAEPAYEVNGEQLCLNGLSFSSSYTATLREGLPDEDGRELDREEDVQISFEDRPPYVGFRGSGIILPRGDADGLPVETVNVDEVRVTVSRVNDRALAFKSINRGVEAAEGRYAYVYGDENPSDVSSEIWSGTMAIQNLKNAPVTTVFPLPDVIETLEPGAYYIEVQDTKELGRYDGPAASAKRWIMLTDLALTAYRGQSGLDVTLRSLQDGGVLPNTPVQLIARNNEVLAQSETGTDGRVQFNAELLAGTGNMAPKIIMARGLKGDTAVLDLTRASVDMSELNVGGRATPGPVDSYLYTERGIYRPGETVHLTALFRDRAGRAVGERAGTLITYRPNGMEALRERFLVSDAGSLQRDIPLSRSAARGAWRSVVEIDGLGQVGTVSYSVEDFVPQRIAVELTAEEAPILLNDRPREVDVDARFLYGAPGAALTVKSQARVEVDPSPFDSYDGYQWGSHSATFREQIVDITDRTTDGAGKTTVRLDVGQRGKGSGRPLRVNAVVSVLEPGGRAVTESVRIPFRPDDVYIGTKPAFEGRIGRGETAVFDIAAVGADGSGLDADLRFKVLEIDYHYDWYRENGQWKWRRSRTVRTVNEGPLQASDGAAQVSVSGLDWGAHELIIESETGTKASREFYVGWGGRVSDDGIEAPDRVQVSLDDQVVIAGRPAALTIVPPYDGEAQIVVATDRVLSVETRAVEAEGTQITLPVTEEWGEGAYVMVNVYTARDPILQAKPRRAVGVGYVPVSMDERTFEIEIDAPELVRPGTQETISVKLDNGPGGQAYVTLAAVDEGILRLTKFSSPDPVDWFFGKKSLGVALYDDYGRLLDPNLGLPAEVRSGGDQLGGEGLSVVPTKTVALFSGVVEVGRGGEARIQVDVPDFNGEVRLMAVAWSETGLGKADKAMTVREQAPSDVIFPRFLAPGDEAVVTVSVDNIELADGDFNANLVATDPVSVTTEGFTQTIPNGQRSDQGVRIASTGEGISRVRLNVEGPDDFSTERTYMIQSRSPFLPVTTVERALMEAGQTYAPDAALFADFVPGTAEMVVSFSGLPVDPNALYQSLARYPYGCTEQTISRAMPLVYAEQLVEQGASDDRPEAREQVQAAINTVLNRQSDNGAFGLWREGDRNASPWLGAYTTDFLYRADQSGYEVPKAALDRAYQAMRAVSQGDAWRVYGYETNVYESRWHDDTERKLMRRSAPYALYVLARAGKADVSRLRYLHDRELDEMRSPLARAHLAAALAYMGDRSRANSAFTAAEEALGYLNNGDYYQTQLRDLAGVLALAAETDFNEHVARLAEKLAEDTPEPDRLTTQEKAFMLLAVDGLSGEDGASIAASGVRRGDDDRRFFLTQQQVENGTSFRLRRNSSAAFRTVMVTGSPLDAPPAAGEGLGITKSIRNLTGGRVNLNSVKQGDQMVVVIMLDPEQRRNNPVIVADLLPAGFEIETVLQPSDGRQRGNRDGAFAWIGEIDRAETAEARDDRFIAAIDVVAEDRTLAYVVRAVTPGTFALPGVTAEDMYRPDVFARSSAGTVTIQAQRPGPGGTQ
ncbi:MAG: alpha-2-macroglobulin [Pseudomonadota bacterium]